VSGLTVELLKNPLSGKTGAITPYSFSAQILIPRNIVTSPAISTVLTTATVGRGDTIGAFLALLTIITIRAAPTTRTVDTIRAILTVPAVVTIDTTEAVDIAVIIHNFHSGDIILITRKTLTVVKMPKTFFGYNINNGCFD